MSASRVLADETTMGEASEWHTEDSSGCPAFVLLMVKTGYVCRGCGWRLLDRE
jgi:hypothetical protein